MALVPVAAYQTTNFSFSVDGNDYAAALSSAVINVAQSNSTFQGGTEDASFTFAGKPQYSIAATYAQDWATDGSLSEVLWERQGEQVTAIFKPDNARPFTATIILATGQVGGDVNSPATSTVTFSVLGKPVMGAAV